MATKTLSEERLHPFLWRRRRGSAVIELPSMTGMFRETLSLAARLVAVDGIALLLDDPAHRLEKGSTLTVIATQGRTKRRVGDTTTYDAEPLVRRVYVEGRAIHGRGAATGDVALPIRLEHAVCGVLVVERSARGRINKSELGILELVSRYIARAILNAVDILKQSALAQQDDLTGVKSVRGLEPMLRHELMQAKKHRTDLSVLFVDVDRLKHVNDALGHDAGSEALVRIGRVLRDHFDGCGATFRFGGDEFVAVCPGIPAKQALQLANDLRVAVLAATPGPMSGRRKLPPISVSVGVASLRGALVKKGDFETFSSRLVRAADRALYRAKRTRDTAELATRADDPENDGLRRRGKKR